MENMKGKAKVSFIIILAIAMIITLCMGIRYAVLAAGYRNPSNVNAKFGADSVEINVWITFGEQDSIYNSIKIKANKKSLSNYNIWLNGGNAISDNNKLTAEVSGESKNKPAIITVDSIGSFGIKQKGHEKADNDDKYEDTYVRQAGAQINISYEVQKGYTFEKVDNDGSYATFAGLIRNGSGEVGNINRTLWSFKNYDKKSYSTNDNKFDEGKAYIVADLQKIIDGKTYGALNIDYKPINYAITYDLQGGTETKNPATYNIETADITLNNPTKTGYTFTGWTGSNGNTAQSTVKIPKGSTGAKSYIANWTPINYTIKYDLDGGTVTKNPATYNIETATFTLNNPTKTGYTFTGWTGSNGATAQSTVTINKGSTGDKSYKANWIPTNYSIAYELNGGTDPGNPATYNIESETITLSNPTRTGYIFSGWTGSNGTTPQTSVTITKGTTGDKSYTANWTPITYTVKYDGNGYTGGSTANSSHTYDAKNSVATNGFKREYTVSFNANGGTTVSPIVSKYTFYRWRQYANATGWSFTSGQTNVGNLSSSNGATVTLYATWTPVAIKLPSVSRNAYSFTGWYSGQTKVGGINADYTPSANTTLKAGWELIKTSVSGTVNWDDQNNKYNARPKNASGIETVDVTLNSDEPVTEIASGALATPNTQTVVGENYTFSNLQKNKVKDNSAYTYTVTQNVIPGYETLINGYTITNKLILPTYSSNITYVPVNSFENRYLKNGRVKVTGEVTANRDNRSEVGLNQGKAIFNVDSGIAIDKSKVTVNYYNAETNTTTKLTNYTISGNTITAIFGKDSNGISKKGDKITIEIEGTLTKLGGYSSSIIATGKLRDYRGANTNIDLGQVTNTTKTINVDYQLPRANIKIQKIDSITKEKLTDAKFTLYEWDGTKYVQKEIITDSNKDGIYESNYYEWNVTTNGKYKIVETGIPESHKDLNWTMEYKLNQLKTENYTVKPDYSNSQYKISYATRNPDEFTRTDGIVENEPWKLKAKIEKVDLETHNTIQSETQFTIYEWNQTNNSYELFISKATGKEVKMVRQADKTYLSGEWLYYTQNNKGKYRIIETKAPQGYYANYDQTKQKITYDINIKDIINAGKFENQSINNEGTIFISNNNDLTLTNKRQKARLNLTVVDKETKSNAQADAVLQNAKYGIYALENIYHADGVTTRYSGTPGLLYKKDELIETQISNEQGKMLFDNLECGKYYIKMLQAPEGYLIDETVYSIDFSYKGETVEIIEVNGILELKVKKQAFQMYKIKEDSTVLNNAGFSIYLVNDLSIVKQGKIRKVTTERYELIDTKAQKDERIKQRQNADGTYYLKDLVDYYYKIMYEEGNEQVLPGDDKVYHPYNLSSETLVKDYSNSSQGETIQEIRTNDKGYLKSPELAYGEYVAIETSVPRKQDTASPIVVKVEQDSRTLQDLRFVRDNNFRTKVKIYIRDVQTSQTILNKNIKYIIRNIDTQEYMTHKIWVPNEGYVEYGTPDKPFEAQKTGFIITPMKLEVGQYELIEITAGEGYTTNKFEGTSVNGQTQLNSRDNIRFEIRTNTAYYTDTYLGDYIIVVNETNKSVVGDITVKTQGEYLSNIVTDSNQNYSFEYTNRNVSNAKYQIIAKEDIYTQDNQGQKIYSKDEVVGYITTNEKGEGIIENLPLGKYIIKQVECPAGFTINTNDKEVEIDYQGQEVPVVFKNVEQEQIRQKIEILIHNKDEEEQNINRQGGKYGLYTKEEIRYTDKNGNVKIIPENTLLQTKTSNENGEIKFNSQENVDLPQGKYYVKEIEAPEGYVLQEKQVDIDTIKDNQKQAILKIEKDLVGQKTNVKVQDINEEEQLVAGSKLQIVEKDTGKIIETWQTEAQIKTFRKLKVNTKYIVKQIEPARGYVTAEEVEFIIKTNGKIEINGQEQEENIINIISRQTKLDIILKDEIDSSYVSGVKFKILNKNTNEEMATFVMPASPQRVLGLPIGNYVLKEIEIPNLGYVTINDVDFEVRDTKDVQQLEIIQSVSKLEIHIFDELENTKYVEETKWQIVDKETEEVKDEWVQDGNKHEVKKLPIGNYILKEVEVPKTSGYVTINDVEFEIKDTLEVQQVREIQSVSKLEVHIFDELENEKYVEGTKWQIVEKDTGKVKDEWVQDGNKHEVKKLPLGNYILKEVEVPSELGYVTIEDKEFTIKDTLEVQQVREIQSVSKLEVHIVDELDNTKYVEGTKWQIVEKNTGKVKDEWVQDGNKHEVKKLPLGNYILKEIEVPSELGYVTIEDKEFEVKDTLEVQQVRVTQSVSKLEVHIFDELENTKYVEGTKWQIVDKETGKVKDEWVQDGNKHEVKKLPIGNYILKEVEVPKTSGYVTINDVEFTIKDTLEVQSVTATQAISKVNIIVYDKQTKEDITSKISLNIVNKETKQVVATTKEIKQEENNTKEEQSNVISNEIANEVVNSNSNEVVNEEINSNTNETIGNDGTNENETSNDDKVLQIKQTEKGYYLERLPIGKYTIVETKIPVKEGFVEYQEIDMSVEDTLEIQKTEIYQDITKVLINVIDEETKELIEDANLQILDKETKQIIAQTKEEINDNENNTTNEEKTKEDKTLEIKKTKDGYYLERLPIGEYILIQQTKDGYHEIEQKEIKIENTKEIQKFDIINIRLKYDMKVEKQLEKITFDGEETLIDNSDVRKIEIRERKISTANVKLQYVIKVSNVGETDAKVGTIIDKIPEGFTLVTKESNGWIMDKNLATYKAYENETIKPGETKQVRITVKWKNSVTNFGEKMNTAMVINSSNPYGYEDKNKENDEGKSLVVISVGTGIETAVTAARIIMVAFIGSMTVCLVAAIELMIKQKRKE